MCVMDHHSWHGSTRMLQYDMTFFALVSTEKTALELVRESVV